MTTSDIIKLNGKKIKTTNLLFENFSSISNHFKKYGINIKNIHKNKSNKYFTKACLTNEHFNFINNFYKEDFDIYNKMLLN
jgi:hypothetical protein